MGADNEESPRQKKRVRGQNAKTSSRSIKKVSLAARVIELRKQGHTFEAISQALGITRSWAYKLTIFVLDETKTQAAEELRELENRRYDAMMEAIWQDAMSGDLHAIERMIKLSKARRELNGLDVPSKTQLDMSHKLDETQAKEDFMSILGKIASSLEK
jgi:ribosomal protein S13